MLARLKAGLLDPQFPGHAEMNTEPGVVLCAALFRDEEHLLAERLGTFERRVGQRLDELLRIDAAKDALLFMDHHTLDPLLQAGVPLLAKIIDLGQFGHDKDSHEVAVMQEARNIDERASGL